LCDDPTGKLIWNNGNIYEGVWKDNNMHGQGKKEVIYFVFYLLSYCLIIQKGKWFWTNGDRYVGEWKNGK